LTEADLQALANIQEASSAIFHNSAIDIQVLEKGAIEVTMRGQVQSKPEAEGDVWVPVLLVRKLPEYFEALNPEKSGGAVLEAYQLTSGLWCIAAVVHQNAAAATPIESTTSGFQPLNIHIAFAAERFGTEETPILKSGMLGLITPLPRQMRSLPN